VVRGKWVPYFPTGERPGGGNRWWVRWIGGGRWTPVVGLVAVETGGGSGGSVAAGGQMVGPVDGRWTAVAGVAAVAAGRRWANRPSRRRRPRWRPVRPGARAPRWPDRAR